MFSRRIGSILSLTLLIGGLPWVADAQDRFDPPDRGKPQRTDDGGTRGDLLMFQPRDRGLPGRRDDGGTRGPQSCFSGNPPNLALLLPMTNVSVTTAAYPRFFWYVSQTNAKRARFDLFKVDPRSQLRTSVYSQSINLTGKPGVMSVTLPNTGNIQPLEVDRDYYWTVTIACNPQEKLPRPQVTVDGWVQRVSLNEDETAQLRQLTSRERLQFYAEKGLWGDLISSLADLRACRPTDKNLSNSWESVLKSVNLNAIAPSPLLQAQCPKGN
jgi:hypothetical protein